MTRIPRIAAIAAVLGAAGAMASAGSAMAAGTFYANKLTDSDTAPATCGATDACSLREAVGLAAASGGTVQLKAGAAYVVSSAITVDSGNTVLIEGPDGATLPTISSSGTGDVLVADGSPLSIYRVHFVGSATAGDAILAATEDGGPASLALREVSLTGNNAGSKSGGAIYFDGGAGSTLLIDSSSIVGNSATGGGALQTFSGTTVISNSFLGNNEAPTGSVIANSGGTVRLVSSTISGSSTHAALWGDETATAPPAAYVLFDTIIDQGANGCTGYNAPTASQFAALFTDAGGNVDRGSSCKFAGRSNLDPQLGPIQAVGSFQTRVPAITSPAVDGGAAAATCIDSASLAAVTSNNLLIRANPIVSGTPSIATLVGTGDIADDNARPTDGNGDGTAACDSGAYEFFPAYYDYASPATSTPTAAGVTLKGIVSKRDEAVSAYFEYGTSGTTLTQTTAAVAITSTDDTPVNGSVTNFGPNDVIYYRLVIVDAGGRKWAAATKFVKTIVVATVGKTSQDAVTSTTATLNATLDPNGLSPQTYFEWGTTTAYGSSSPVLPAPASLTAKVPVSQAIDGLTPSTKYHFRAVTVSNGYTYYSADDTFTTKAAAVVKAPTPSPAPVVKPVAITLALSALKPVSLKKFPKKGLVVTGTCSAACTLSAHLDVTAKQAKKLKLKKGTTVVATATGTGSVTFQLKKSLLAKLKKAKVKSLTLTVVGTPTAANFLPTTTTTTVKLK